MPVVSAQPVLNGLSVDVEEWFQVGAFERVIDRADWDGLESRVERNVEAILALFDGAGVKATFFTLGWVAQRHPRLIARIAQAGHEIASHGWDHARVFTLDAARFAADLARARDVLEQASGQRVTGYRAPASRSTRARPGRTACWRRQAMPIPPASPRWSTITMAGPRRRALPFAPWPMRRWSKFR
jgi:polysaccharide deacetylase family protein (PEP-CTERM system associated)